MNYISIDRIDDEVRGRLKTYNEQGKIDPDDVVKYTFDALRKIGVSTMLEAAWLCVDVVNHKGVKNKEVFQTLGAYRILDKSVVNQNAIFQITTNVEQTFEEGATCDGELTTSTTTTTVITKEDCSGTELLFVKKTVPITDVISVLQVSCPMYYGGSDLSLLADSDSNILVSNMDSYIYRGNTIVTSFKTGTILINYLKWVVDEDGRPMVPDEQDVIDAVVAFNIFMILEGEFYDRVDGINSVYAEAKTNWENFRAMAQNYLKMISIDEAYSKVRAANNRYIKFRF